MARSNRGLTRWVQVGLVVAVTFSSHAAAQSRVEVILSGTSGEGCTGIPEPPPTVPCEHRPGRIIEFDVDAWGVATTTETPENFTNPGVVVTADGRYVVWGGLDDFVPPASFSTSVSFRDRLTGSVLSAGRIRSFGGPDGAPPLLAHPTEVRVYAWQWELSARSTRSFMPISAIDPNGRFGLSTSNLNFEVIDLVRRTVQCTIPRDRFVPRGTFSADGSSVLLSTLTANGRQQSLSRFDARTCELQLQVAGGGQVLGVDPTTGRIVAGWGNNTYVYHPVTLAQLAVVPGPPDTVGHNMELAFDSHASRAYVLRTPPITYQVPFVNNLQVINLASLTAAGDVNLAPDLRATGFAAVPRPSRPTNVHAIVEGRRVRIEWQRGTGPGMAAGYRVEAGSAPGLTDIATFNQIGNVFVIDGVRRGRYFVRVRGTSAGGVSAASTEIVVEVQ